VIKVVEHDSQDSDGLQRCRIPQVQLSHCWLPAIGGVPGSTQPGPTRCRAVTNFTEKHLEPMEIAVETW
jgi:hypothetical protein